MSFSCALLVALIAWSAAAPAAGVLVGLDGRRVRIRSHRVDARFENGLVRTTVRQVFVNQHDAVLEAIYLFPLPTEAALTDVTMVAGGKRLEGLLAERKKARRVYDAIVRKRRDPALVEQIGRSKFRLSVYPVVPNEETVVEITYVERIPLARGVFRYVYPLATGGESSKTEHDLTFSMSVRSAAPIAEVTASAREAEVVANDGGYRVSLERTGAALDQDLSVTVTLRRARPSIAVETFRDGSGDGWFQLLLTPPPVDASELVPRDVTLVIDTSGSMEGEKITQAKASVRYLLEHLRPADRVNLVTFSSTVIPFADRPVAATPEHLAKLRDFVDTIEAKGSTAFGEALTASLDAAARSATRGRVAMVVMLTDGHPTIGETDPTALVRLAKAKAGAVRGPRVFTFGVGGNVAAGLLHGIAAAARGRAEVFREGGEIETRIRRFLDRTSAPVLANVKLDAPGTYDVFPRPLPDVYLGEQVVIVGRYRETGEKTFTVDASSGTRDAHFQVNANLRAREGGSRAVRDLFARMKIDFLERQRRLRVGLSDTAYFAALDRGAYSTENEIVAEIIDTSLTHGVQSAYTSFIALLPEDRRRIDPRNAAALQRAIERRSAAGRGTTRALGAEEAEVESVEVVDDVVTDQPFEGKQYEGKQSNAAIGLGTGGGLRRRYGGEGFDDAVEAPLEWLAWSQVREKGYWGSDPGRPGKTGLALMAYQGAGYTHQAGKYRRMVLDALKYLRRSQQIDGRFGAASDVVDHAMATLAMCYAYGRTGSPLLRRPAEKAVALLRRAVKAEVRDPAILAWSAMALASARAAGIVSAAVVAKELRSLVERLAAADVARASAPPSTAIARDAAVIFLRGFALGETIGDDDPALTRIVAALAPADGGAVDLSDAGLCYFGPLAGFQIGGATWKRVKEGMKRSLFSEMAEGGDARGSWPATGRDAKRLGREGITALRAQAVQLYYRYGKVFGAR